MTVVLAVVAGALTGAGVRWAHRRAVRQGRPAWERRAVLGLALVALLALAGSLAPHDTQRLLPALAVSYAAALVVVAVRDRRRDPRAAPVPGSPPNPRRGALG